VKKCLYLVIYLSLGLFETLNATVIFSDNFQSGPSSSWGNQLGNWIAQDGKYYASATGSSFPLWPLPQTLLPFEVTDFTVDIKIWDFKNGGVMLRAQDSQNAILLVLGGLGGVGDYMYWHILQDGNVGSGLNPSSSIGAIGQYDPSLHIVVEGDTYKVYLDGSTNPATTLTTSAFSSGKVGLFDNASPETSFSDIVITVPEPSALSLLAVGLGGSAVLAYNKQRK